MVKVLISIFHVGLVLQSKNPWIEKKIAADPPGFEPGSEAPEASILSRLYYESKIIGAYRYGLYPGGD